MQPKAEGEGEKSRGNEATGKGKFYIILIPISWKRVRS